MGVYMGAIFGISDNPVSTLHSTISVEGPVQTPKYVLKELPNGIYQDKFELSNVQKVIKPKNTFKNFLSTLIKGAKRV